eukprot:6124053-Prymnesium_polylepis.1
MQFRFFSARARALKLTLRSPSPQVPSRAERDAEEEKRAAARAACRAVSVRSTDRVRGFARVLRGWGRDGVG